jgi:hypothetical protein
VKARSDQTGNYEAHGLVFDSEIPIPEFNTVASGADVEIKCHDDLTRVHGAQDGLIQIADDRLVFSWNQIGKYEVTAGRRVDVWPVSEASDEHLRLPLIGVVLSAVLYQRGFRVLHASAVLVDGVAIAFVGRKGAGKSTMASMMFSNGYPVLTDDVLAIPESKGKKIFATAGTAQLKLWPDSLDSTSLMWENSSPIYKGACKRLLVDQDNLQGEFPLGRIYLLRVGEGLAIRPVQRNDALIEMVRNSFSYRYLRDQPGTAAYVLEAYSSIARHVPVKVLQRDADLSRLGEVAEAVVADLDQRV